MARIARFVVPGLPHHVTQRGNRRERVFFGDEDYELYRDLLCEPVPQAGRRRLGLLPDAEPRPSHPRPRSRGGAGPGARRDASALLLGRQRPAPGDRPSLPVALRLRRHGRGASDGGGALCRAEPGAGAARRAGRGLALVEREGASRRPGRRLGQRRAAHRSQRRPLRRPSRPAASPPRRSSALRAAETIGRPLGSPAFLDRLAAATGRDPAPGEARTQKWLAASRLACSWRWAVIGKYQCVTEISRNFPKYLEISEISPKPRAGVLLDWRVPHIEKRIALGVISG